MNFFSVVIRKGDLTDSLEKIYRDYKIFTPTGDWVYKRLGGGTWYIDAALIDKSELSIFCPTTSNKYFNLCSETVGITTSIMAYQHLSNDANYSKYLALLQTASLQSAKSHTIHSILNRKKSCA